MLTMLHTQVVHVSFIGQRRKIKHFEDYRLALTLAENANSYNDEKDSYWKMAMALCNLRLGMIRKAEEYAIDFTKATKLPSGAILLSHIYRKLDQPVAAAKTLSKCIRKYPNDILLLSNLARLDSLRIAFITWKHQGKNICRSLAMVLQL